MKTELDIELYARNHSEAERFAHEKAHAYFRGHPYRLVEFRVTPAVMSRGGDIRLWRVGVEAEAA